MRKIFKFSGYLVDDKDMIDFTEKNIVNYPLISIIKSKLRHFHCEQTEYNEEDEFTLKAPNSDLAFYEKYFKSEPSKLNGREVKVGQVYRHFKEGKLVKVIAISQDTENVGSFSVVYECMDKDNNKKIWHRPYDMFVSEVDHNKYPDAGQKYRFELVEE